MRIAFLLDAFPKLSETFILHQITGLLKRGQDVDIYPHLRPIESKTHSDIEKYKLSERTHYLTCPENKLKRLINGLGIFLKSFPEKPKALLNTLNIHKFGRNAASLVILYHVSSFLDRRQYDLIHCHFGPNGILALLMRQTGAFDGKIITTFYGYDLQSYTKKNGDDVYKALFKEGDLFLCLSERMKQDLLNLGCNEQKIFLHRLGVDLGKFALSTSKPKNPSKIQLLSIARLVEKKGLQYGIEAVAHLIKKYPHIHYTIIGDGPLRSHLSSLIDMSQATENIQLVGWMEQGEILEWMDKADIFLAPSVTAQNGDQEGTPLAIIEALARGLPVLSTRHSGIPELIQDGESGILVPERDVAALINGLEHLITHPEIWPEMGRKGRSYVEGHHDIDKLNDRLVEIYHQTLYPR